MKQENQAYQRYRLWMNELLVDDQTKLELQTIADNAKEIEDRFYKDLEFGTGGLRGVIGAGTNRMNLYTIGKATQGLAQYIKDICLRDHSVQHANASVVIAYDSRHQSPEFALQAALVLAANDIQAFVFESLRPTPELSFAVRELQAAAGIVITASHNPPEYNGFKVYGSDGGQIVQESAHQVLEQIRKVASFADIHIMSKEEAEQTNLLCWIGESMDQRYIQAVTSVSQHAAIITGSTNDLPPYHKNIKVVYTPLHGAGNISVRAALKQIGCTQVHVVKEQEWPDAEFSTVRSPNPEEAEAFTLAIELAEKINADLIIGTDPDCDRMGVVARNNEDQFEVLSGNQAGSILIYYLLSQLQANGKLPQNGAIIKTIVTSELGAKIAESYGVSVINTLTGFKYIGEKMSEFERTGEHQFLFGYEESYGYLAGTYCRDKDAVVASMLICEAAAFYKSKGKSLYDVLQDIYKTYGYFVEKLESRTLKGKAGTEQIGRIMQAFRQNPPAQINEVQVLECKDYQLGIEGLPKENVLKYVLEDGSWFCLRPSGTEPKIKIYFGVVCSIAVESSSQIELLKNAVMQQLDQMI